MTFIKHHPEKDVIRAQLKQNRVIKDMAPHDFADLEHHLVIADCKKGECLLHQGNKDLEIIFVLDGILKRTVSNSHAKEMILRFTSATNIEATYASLRLKKAAPFSIYALTKTRVAKMPLRQWVSFIESDSRAYMRQIFETEVLTIMNGIMAHTISLHLSDAPGRVHRFLRKHPDLFDSMPKKELASYLNLTAETISRLKNQGKI